ncbi:MAG: hypothetical protein GY751_02680 [Bacteroidetes bacterium]|nr:hypothetical protein [Bacteroidota bacterium]
MQLNTKHYYLIYFVTIFLIHGIGIRNEYNIDDEFVTEGHELVGKGVKGIPEIFRSTYIDNEVANLGYRPLTAASFALERSLFGKNPHLSHFFNLLIYFLVIVLIHVFIRQLFPEIRGPVLLFTILIFIVHPLHVEVVASLKNREELIVSVCYLMAGIFLFRMMYGNKEGLLKNGLVITFFLFVGLFTKPNIINVIFLPFIFILMHGEGIKLTFRRLAPPILLILILIIIHNVFRSKNIEQTSILAHYLSENPIQYIALIRSKLGFISNIFLEYLKLLVFPVKLRWYRGFDMIQVIDIFSPRSILSILIHLAIITTAWIARKRNPVIFFAIAFYFTNLFIYTSIISPYAGIVSERALFMPSLGFCILVPYLADYYFYKLRFATHHREKLFMAFCSIIILSFSVISFERTTDWKNREALIFGDISKLERSAYANHITGLTYFNILKKDPDNQQVRENAITYFNNAIEIDPSLTSSNYQLSLLYSSIDADHNSALNKAFLAYKFDPLADKVTFEIGRNYQALAKLDSAIIFYVKTRQLNDKNYTNLYYLSQVYFEIGAVGKAFDINDELRNKLPNADLAYLNLGSFNLKLGNEAVAMGNFEMAIANGCSDKRLFQLLMDYYERNNYPESQINALRLKIND